MKLIHLSDLHLGKRVNEFSMLEDQAYILEEILSIIQEEQPEAVLIAGDVYDKAVPPADAVQLFDDFITGLAALKLSVFIISGNHDSPERLSFGARVMQHSGIHLAPVYSGDLSPVTLNDDQGPVNFYMLPFIKPVHVRRYFESAPTDSYTEALRTALSQTVLTPGSRNVLLAHQLVLGALRSESEEISIGGTDSVDATVFDGFDYVALGHLHRAQSVSRDTVRYCGTPLKYAFSEAGHMKSLTIVELREKGTILMRERPLIPKRDLRELRGDYMALTAKSAYEGTALDDYLHITLTDEEDIPDAIGKLRAIYPNIMTLDYDNKRTRHRNDISGDDRSVIKDPLTLFAEFYTLLNNQPLSPQQESYMAAQIKTLWEGSI